MPLPPYRVTEFRASSGNHARIKVWMRERRTAVDCTWEGRPSDSDVTECSAYVHTWIQERSPGLNVLAPVNVLLEDSSTAQREQLAKMAVLDDHELNCN